MSDAVLGGASIAWRLLATLEGGSLVVAASALMAYAARGKRTEGKLSTRDVKKVLVSNPNTSLGKEIITRLELRGCEVCTLTSEAGGDVISDSGDKVDAMVIVGAGVKIEGLEGMAGLVSEDVYRNLKVLESLSGRLRNGGRIIWACASCGDNNNNNGGDGVYAATMQAYDTVLQATLQHVAKVVHCAPFWIDRCDSQQETAERTIATLVSNNTPESQPGIALRNSMKTLFGYLTRWTKATTTQSY